MENNKTLEELIDNPKSFYASKIQNNIIMLLFPVVAMSINLAYAYFEKISFLKTIETKTVFICKSRNSESFSIKVDKNRGWILKDGYFVKDNNKVQIERCKAKEEEL